MLLDWLAVSICPGSPDVVHVSEFSVIRHRLRKPLLT
jgi:hypothetical protein